MKKTMINLIFTSLLTAAGTATPLSLSGPGDPPLCYPGEPACPIKAAIH